MNRLILRSNDGNKDIIEDVIGYEFNSGFIIVKYSLSKFEIIPMGEISTIEWE